MKLTKTEREQLTRFGKGRPEEGPSVSAPPKPPVLTGAEYIRFASFASRFARTPKRVYFVGDHWKL